MVAKEKLEVITKLVDEQKKEIKKLKEVNEEIQEQKQVRFWYN